MLTLPDPGYDFWRRFADGRECNQHPVLSRWARVRRLREPTSGGVVQSEWVEGAGPNLRGRAWAVLQRNCEMIQASAEELYRRGCALVVTDAEGFVVASFGDDAIPDPAMSRAFRVGNVWDEKVRGTNAIGTVLAEGMAIAVLGHAHYDEAAHGLVCYAAPIHDVDGRLTAVLDVSGPVSAADPLLGVLVQSLAAAIEGAVRAQAVDRYAEQIDTLREREAEARRVHDALVETLQANETFLAEVGHDLRNPLTAVTTGAELLLVRSEGFAHRHVAERIRASSQRMVRMLDELFDLSRARVGGGILLKPNQNVELADIAERVVSEQRLAHPRYVINFTKAGATQGAWDEVRIGQIVSNLVGNAIRHGSGDVPIGVYVDASRDFVVLTVTNPGEIAAAARAHLFEPFRSGPREGAPAEGLGLGLFIVDQIVRAHAGAIEVTSAHGFTTFRVSLPRVGGDRRS